MIATLRPGSRRTLVVLAALVLALLPGGGTRSADDPLLARAFEVHYRPLPDAAELIEALLSPDGTVTLRKRLNTLVVQDHESVLRRVQALLESYDVPPRNAELTFSLILGTERRPEPAANPDDRGGTLSKEVRGVLEILSDVTKWTAYESLGSRSVTGSEGETMVANLSQEYRVVFLLESVQEKQGKIKLEQLALQRLRVGEDGSKNFEELYRAGLVLNAGRVTLVGAARDPKSNTALFLAVQATPR